MADVRFSCYPKRVDEPSRIFDNGVDMLDTERREIRDAAVMLFPNETLFRISNEVDQLGENSRLSYWQDEVLLKLSRHMGTILEGSTDFLDIFKGFR